MNRDRQIIHNLAQFGQTEIGAYAFQTLDSVDTKTATLLTHVSIMLAVSGFFYGYTKGAFEKTLLLAEIVSYLVISIGCLRSVFTTSLKHLPEDPEALAERMLEIGDQRSRAYELCLRAAIGVSLAFIFTVVIGEGKVIETLSRWFSGHF